MVAKMKQYQQLKYITLVNPNQPNATEQVIIRGKYNELLQTISKNRETTNDNIFVQIQELKGLLTELRDTLKYKLKKVKSVTKLQGLYQHISPDMIHRNNEEQNHANKDPNYNIRPGVEASLPGIVARAYQQAEHDLLQAEITRPCDYAVIGLGSMSMQQATAYSDLEFAIIISGKENDSTRMYFKNLTHLVHFRIIQLGETYWWHNNNREVQFNNDIQIREYGYNTKKGVSFDTWDKTPFGKECKYELIRNVDGFLEYLRNEHKSTEKKDPLLHSMLETTCFIYGKESLFKDYHERACMELQKDYQSNKDQAANRFDRMFLHDRDQVEEYNKDSRKVHATKPIITEYAESVRRIQSFLNEESDILNVKQDIYRLIDRALYTYAGKHGWFQESIFQLLYRLYDGISKSTVDSETCQYLHKMVYFAMKLKLLHHEHNRGRESGTIDMDFLERNHLKAELATYLENAQGLQDLIKTEFTSCIDQQEYIITSSEILWTEPDNHNHKLKADGLIYKWGKKFNKAESDAFIKLHHLEEYLLAPTEQNSVELGAFLTGVVNEAMY
jgi:hypothetical protein